MYVCTCVRIIIIISSSSSSSSIVNYNHSIITPGEYNRANRALHHYAENSISVALSGPYRERITWPYTHRPPKGGPNRGSDQQVASMPLLSYFWLS